jgi:hypothetical protein
VTEQLSNLPIERLDKRIHIALPIRVTYWDSENKPCLELACTYDISARGARISGLRCVKGEGEIIAVERGRNKAFCRVVWVGEAGSELRSQVGIQCLETDRLMWEAELRDMEEVYDPIQREMKLCRLNSMSATNGNRRRQPRFEIQGLAELLRRGPNAAHTEAELKNLSELGCMLTTNHLLLPGTDLKLVLNIAKYDLSLKGQVRHTASNMGLGVEFHEIRKGDRQILQYLLRKLAERQEQEEKPKTKAAVASF